MKIQKKYSLSLLTSISTIFFLPTIVISCNSKSSSNDSKPEEPNVANQKFGFNITSFDKYMNKDVCDENVNFNNVIKHGNDFINNELNNSQLKDYLNLFALNYAQRFVSSRSNAVEFEIIESNINLNQNKKVDGNIKIQFKFSKNLTSPLMDAIRNQGDIEIHNFVFDDSSIEPYINTSISNFLSFKITTKYLQKQLISNVDSSRNFNVGISNEIIYLDDCQDLTLQFNNSIFNINIEH